MSKKVNVMADVEQSVYDAVVVPHKQSKTFTSLIESLIEGYYSNAYIRSYVDDKLEGIQHESNDVLNDIINSMHQGLANMGVYTDEIKSTAQEGVDAFSQKSDEVKKEMDDLQTKEMKDMKDSIDMLKAQNEEIMDMLKSFVSGGAGIFVGQSQAQGVGLVSSDIPKGIKVVEEEKDVIAEEQPVVAKTRVAVEDSAEVIAEESSKPEEVSEEPEEETSSEEAFDIMASLLDGQEYSF